jgi:hypothetical protein
MKSVLINMSRSTTASQLSHSAPESTTSTSALEAHVQATSVDQFPENSDIIEQLVCQVAERSTRQCPRRS